MPSPKGLIESKKWKENLSISHKGQVAWSKGKKLTEEHKKRLSESHKGKPTWNKGKSGLQKHSLEARRRMSEIRKGDKAPNWQGGKTDKSKKIRNGIEFRLWRESVFARDNWTCQKYGIKGGKLHPHHIQNFAQYPELRFAIDNGITLSEKAHREFHRKYGIKNNTKEQLEEFLWKNKK